MKEKMKDSEKKWNNAIPSFYLRPEKKKLMLKEIKEMDSWKKELRGKRIEKWQSEEEKGEKLTLRDAFPLP